jgi:C1A family cysteine protease
MKAIILIALLGAVAATATNEQVLLGKFNDFKTKFGKTYSCSGEESMRMEIFRANLERAEAMQAMDGDAIYGVTRFMDLSPEEFKRSHLNYQPSGIDETVAVEPSNCMYRSPNADGFDWRSKGAVTAVKDQGQCGSCWAFSAVEEMESMWNLAGNKLIELSPQQVVSCDKGAGDLGCQGGDTVIAYKYMIKAGLETEASYPYTSGDTGSDGKCTFDSAKVAAKMQNWTYATPPCMDSCAKQDENTLQANLEKTGPVSVCVAADSWQFYSGGILSSNCPRAYSSLDHCVQLTGWGMSGATKYWALRNSWGTSWGIQGYIHVKFGSNLCGLADEATFTKS